MITARVLSGLGVLVLRYPVAFVCSDTEYTDLGPTSRSTTAEFLSLCEDLRSDPAKRGCQ